MKNIGHVATTSHKLEDKKINLHLSYPDNDIRFEHFSKACIKRVKFLRDIENLKKNKINQN